MMQSAFGNPNVCDLFIAHNEVLKKADNLKNCHSEPRRRRERGNLRSGELIGIYKLKRLFEDMDSARQNRRALISSLEYAPRCIGIDYTQDIVYHAGRGAVCGVKFYAVKLVVKGYIA